MYGMSSNHEAIRVLRFEVYTIQGDHRAVRRRWHDLADQCQQAVNLIWETWLVWHVLQKSAPAIRDYLDRLARWRKSKNGVKPKLAVVAMPAELRRLCYHHLADEFPTLHQRPRDLLLNDVAGKIRTRKAAKGNLSGWMAILLHNEGVPSTTHPPPVPFDKNNAHLYFDAASGNFAMRIRIDRQATDGKHATSTVDDFQLLTRRKGIARHAGTLRRIVDGELAFKGSKLLWHAKNKKWFALICYAKPKQMAGELDPEHVAVLRPARYRPWTLRLPGGREIKIGGDGQYVAGKRKAVLLQRWGRQEGYRHAGSANKGHGRNRALTPLFRLSLAWKEFVKNANHHTSEHVVKICREHGAGRLVYCQPHGPKRDARFLTTAGKIPDRRDSSGWDWHQVGAMLSYKCADVGVQLTIPGASRNRPRPILEKPPPPRPFRLDGPAQRCL